MATSNHRWLVNLRYLKPYIFEDKFVIHFDVSTVNVLFLFVLVHEVIALRHGDVCMNGVQMVLPTKDCALPALFAVLSIVNSRRLELIVFRHIGADRFLIECLLFYDTLQAQVECLLYFDVSQIPGWRLEIFIEHLAQHLCASHRRPFFFLEQCLLELTLVLQVAIQLHLECAVLKQPLECILDRVQCCVYSAVVIKPASYLVLEVILRLTSGKPIALNVYYQTARNFNYEVSDVKRIVPAETLLKIISH